MRTETTHNKSVHVYYDLQDGGQSQKIMYYTIDKLHKRTQYPEPAGPTNFLSELKKIWREEVKKSKFKRQKVQLTPETII